VSLQIKPTNLTLNQNSENCFLISVIVSPSNPPLAVEVLSANQAMDTQLQPTASISKYLIFIPDDDL